MASPSTATQNNENSKKVSVRQAKREMMMKLPGYLEAVKRVHRERGVILPRDYDYSYTLREALCIYK
ncbi:hypothetical protein BOX15_Mlig003300g1, partial [Macrostomum lignano]